MKVIVAGGRDFTDTQRMHDEIVALVKAGVLTDDCELVSGMARGADITAYRLWMDHYGDPVHEFRPDWNGPLGKGAGFARNAEMARFGDVLVAFWDGQSRGTKHMIETMRALRKPVHVFRY